MSSYHVNLRRKIIRAETEVCGAWDVRAAQVGSLGGRRLVRCPFVWSVLAEGTVGGGDLESLLLGRRGTCLFIREEWMGPVARGAGFACWGRSSRLGRHPS